MRRIVTLALLCSVFTWVSAAAEEHPLGMPHIVFCDAFLKKIGQKMPMNYSDFLKFTDGEGMPVSADRRHWDGQNNSFLTVDLHLNFVKGGVVTCPNGEIKTFGVWDVSN